VAWPGATRTPSKEAGETTTPGGVGVIDRAQGKLIESFAPLGLVLAVLFVGLLAFYTFLAAILWGVVLAISPWRRSTRSFLSHSAIADGWPPRSLESDSACVLCFRRLRSPAHSHPSCRRPSAGSNVLVLLVSARHQSRFSTFHWLASPSGTACRQFRR